MVKLLVVLFSIGLITLNSNVYADSLYTFVPYSSTYNTNVIKNNGVEFAPNSYAIENTSNDGADVYFFLIGNSIHGISTESISIYFAVRTASSTWDWWGFNLSNLDSNSGLYYSDTGNSLPTYSLNNDFTDFPVYSNLQDALNYVSNYTDVPDTTYNYTLQNGWLSVIDLGSSGASYNITLNTSFAEYSHLSEPWWDSTQRYWFTNTMPEVGSTITNSETGTLITWEKTGNTDLIGRSKSAVANLSGTASGRYMIIYNPAYHMFNMFASGNKQESNLPLNISGIPQGATISLFKMDESMHLTGGITSQFISDAGSAVATGSALNITDTFVDSDGNSVIQNSGGGNDIHESSGIVSYIVSINDTLDNFTNQFVQLLSAPITHIQQLVSSGSNFFGVFGSLFTWLPAEVYQVIIGAFIVMVVIGVIKLLL